MWKARIAALNRRTSRRIAIVNPSSTKLRRSRPRRDGLRAWSSPRRARRAAERSCWRMSSKNGRSSSRTVSPYRRARAIGSAWLSRTSRSRCASTAANEQPRPNRGLVRTRLSPTLNRLSAAGAPPGAGLRATGSLRLPMPCTRLTGLGARRIGPRRDSRKRRADCVEGLRPHHRHTQGMFDLWNGQGDRKRAGVAGEDAEFQKAEVAGRRKATARRLGLAGQEAIETRVVEDRAVLDVLRLRGCSGGFEPIDDGRGAARRVDDDVAFDFFAIGRPEAPGDQRPAVVAPRQQAVDEDLRANGHAGLSLDIAADRQLQGGAAADDDRHLLVVRLGDIGGGDGRGQAVGEAKLAPAKGADFIEEPWVLGCDQLSQPREKGVALAQMSDAAARPAVEHRFGAAIRWRRIAVQDGDRSTGRRERQGDA